jgi:ribulose-phosphate 3-epimerase
MSSVLIAPSILSADFANLQRDIEMINSSEADWFHVDIMDGVFVPNISFGFPVVKAIKKHAKKTLDVHLMIVNPENYIEQFREAGADNLTVHYEASTHLHRTLQQIRSSGMKAGIAINPHTAIESLSDIISEADLICLMTVNPGFGGQKFIQAGIERTSRLKELILRKNSKALIEIDGGVDMQNKNALITAGADVLVAGNTVFSASDPVGMIRSLKG